MLRSMAEHEPPAPKPRGETHRRALHDALLGEPRTARELSVALSLRERDVLSHLEHLDRSLDHTGERLEIEPARCLACGFAFDERARLTKPGRCPRCRATRIALPRFSIVPDD